MTRRNWLFLAGGLAVGLGLGLVILFGVVGLTLPGLGGFLGEDENTPAPAVGHLAPDFTLESLGGESLHLSDLRGQPVILNFWATWCGPCRQEMPLFQKTYRQHRPDLNVLAVNLGEERGPVKAFVDEYGLTFQVLLDPEETLTDLYQVRGYPTTFFLDGEGRIQVVHIGSLDETQLAGYLPKIGIVK